MTREDALLRNLQARELAFLQALQDEREANSFDDLSDEDVRRLALKGEL